MNLCRKFIQFVNEEKGNPVFVIKCAFSLFFCYRFLATS